MEISEAYVSASGVRLPFHTGTSTMKSREYGAVWELLRAAVNGEECMYINLLAIFFSMAVHLDKEDAVSM